MNKSKASILFILLTTLLLGCSAKLEDESRLLKESNAKAVQEIADWKAKANQLEERNRSLEQSQKIVGQETLKAKLDLALLGAKITELEKRHEAVVLELSNKVQAVSQTINQTAAIRGDFETALKVIENVSEEATQIVKHPEAFAVIIKGGNLTETRPYLDWEKRFSDAKVKVWSLTNVTIDHEEARKIALEIRSVCEEGHIEGEKIAEVISLAETVARAGKSESGTEKVKAFAKQMADQLNSLKSRRVALKQRISELK